MSPVVLAHRDDDELAVRRSATAHLIEEVGRPTIAARDEILSFFAVRLSSSRAGWFEQEPCGHSTV